jgi:bifunctional DNase/RNase
MEKIRLVVMGLNHSQSHSGAYILVLGEEQGNRRLPIVIGAFEAQSIYVQLENFKYSRPLTHELFKRFADHFNITVKEVIIDQVKEGIFFAKLVCVSDGKESMIDSRTSDAVALAMRFNCPIYTDEQVMSTAGMVMDEKAFLQQDEETDLEEDEDEDEEEVEAHKADLWGYSVEELEEMLQKAVDNEDYEQASLIRDEIKKRN